MGGFGGTWAFVWLGLAAACSTDDKSSRLTQPTTSSASAPASSSATPVPWADKGPAWVALGKLGARATAYSTNGLWVAVLTSSGVLLLDSQAGTPLAFATVEGHEPKWVAFHPRNQALLTLDESSAIVWSIEASGNQVALKHPSALPSSDRLANIAPVFDRTGGLLAVFEPQACIVYDFALRKPLYRVAPYHPVDAAGFSGDSLVFAKATTESGRRDAVISVFRLGTKDVTRFAVTSDLKSPLSMRQGKIAAAEGLWDAFTATQLLHWQGLDNVYEAFRLRQRRGTVLGLLTKDHRSELWLVSDTGTQRKISALPFVVGPFSVRPQDDIIHFLSVTDDNSLRFHRVDLEQGRDDDVLLPQVLCVSDGALMPVATCQSGGPRLKPQPVPRGEPIGPALPQFPKNEPRAARAPQRPKNPWDCTREGEGNCVW